MMENISDGVKKVVSFLQQQQIKHQIRLLAQSTRSAQMAADVLGCTAAEIANSLIFEDAHSHELVLIISSGGHRVDVDYVQQQIHRTLVKASGKDIKSQTGYAIGGVPPVAHNIPLATYVDNSLKRFDVVWAAAGSPYAVFGLAPDLLIDLTQGEWINVVPTIS